jgi:hypothetical protein
LEDDAMTSQKLKADKLQLLQAILERRNPDLLPLVAATMERPLTQAECELLRNQVLQELLETGFDAEWNANRRADQLEALIDDLGNLVP